MGSIVVCLGSFDLVINGYFDIIKWGVNVFDMIYVVVLNNFLKSFLFIGEEWVVLLKEVIKLFFNVVVELYSGLLMEYVKEK